MNPKLLNVLSGLVASGALLGLGLLCTSGADLRARDAMDGSPLAGIDATAIEADAAKADARPQPRRRARATLSMPYFSFAQSLRPRG